MIRYFKAIITYLKWLGFENVLDKDETVKNDIFEEDKGFFSDEQIIFPSNVLKANRNFLIDENIVLLGNED